MCDHNRTTAQDAPVAFQLMRYEMTTQTKTRQTAIAAAMTKASAKATADHAAQKAGNADDAKARAKAHEKTLKVASQIASQLVMHGAAVTAHELHESAKLAGKAKVTWFDALVGAFKAKAWANLSGQDYDTFARKMVADGVALAFASQPAGNHKVYRAEAKVIAIATANGIKSNAKSYNERVQAMRDACKAKGLLGEHGNDKRPEQRAPQMAGAKQTGKARDAQLAAEASAKAGEVKTFDRPLTERLLGMTPIGDYASFLVSMCLDEPAKVKAWLDTVKD